MDSKARTQLISQPVLCYICHVNSGTPLFAIDIKAGLFICPECDKAIKDSCEQIKKLTGGNCEHQY